MAPLASSPLLAAVLALALPGGEIPEKFVPRTEAFDHERREVEIPMRDGVKLHTVILVPRKAAGKCFSEFYGWATCTLALGVAVNTGDPWRLLRPNPGP